MGAKFSRLKNWVAEILSNEDLNAEIDNILDNLDPSGVDGYSTNVTEMQAQTDPGEVGSENLATTTAGEIERLRNEIAQIKGETYWYTNPVTTLSTLNDALGSAGLAPSRLISGASTAGSGQSVALTPQGSGNGDNITIVGTATPLAYSVDSTQYNLSADVVIESQTAAPSSNNTALVNDLSITNAEWTKYIGLYGGGIPIDNIGSEITSLNGQLAALRLDSGGNTEYILCVPDTTNNQIKNVRRGWFFDANGVQIAPITFADNATLTLMNINWIFLSSTGTATTTLNTPSVGSSEPTTPTVGDYWYDLSAQSWKRFDGLNFVSSNSALVGISVIDENGDCVAARSEDYVKPYLTINTLELELDSVTVVKSNVGGRAGVNGVLHQYGTDSVTWDITTDLDTGSEANGVMYFFYITEEGAPKISRQAPDDFVSARGGYYHPTETWRCFGQAFNNASGDLEKLISYHITDVDVAIAESSVDSNDLTLSYWTSPLIQYSFDDSATANAKISNFSRFPIYQDITVPNGATLGHVNQIAASDNAFANADTVVLHMVKVQDYITLGVSSHQRGQGDRVNTLALDAAADTNALYSLQDYTAVQARAVAHGTSLQTSAGTWASNLREFKSGANINVCRRKAVAFTQSATNVTTLTSVVSTDFFFTEKRRIKVSLISRSNSTSTGSQARVFDAGTTASGLVAMFVGSTNHGTLQMTVDISGATAVDMQLPVSSFNWDISNGAVAAGDQNFSLRIASTNAAWDIAIDGIMVIEEMPYDGATI